MSPIRLTVTVGAVALLATSCTWWTRANVSTDGQLLAEPEEFVSDLSADGRYVVFHSLAALHPDDGPATDIFRRDLRTGALDLVSGSPGGFGNSYFPAISADGRFVVFESSAEGLVADDHNGLWDIFHHDTDTGITTRVSVDSDGNEAVGNPGIESRSPDVSADGRFVVFQSDAADLVVGDTNGVTDIFRHDTATGETIRVSEPTTGHPGGGLRPVVSDDGNRVLYLAERSAVGVTTGTGLVAVLADVAAGTTVLASADGSGAAPDLRSTQLDMSGDGRFVSWLSASADLVPGDTNGRLDVFVRDLQTGVVTRASVADDGAESDGFIDNGALSDDGRFVVFDSTDDVLVGDDANGARDAFVRDLLAGTTTRLAPTEGWPGGDREGLWPVISADGRTVAFGSFTAAPSAPTQSDLVVSANPSPLIDATASLPVEPGSSTIVTIPGRGFLDDTLVWSDDAGITMTVDAMRDGRALDVTVSVAPGVPVGPHSINVWNPGTGAGIGSSSTCGGCLDVTG